MAMASDDDNGGDKNEDDDNVGDNSNDDDDDDVGDDDDDDDDSEDDDGWLGSGEIWKCRPRRCHAGKQRYTRRCPQGNWTIFMIWIIIIIISLIPHDALGYWAVFITLVCIRDILVIIASFSLNVTAV